MLSRGVKAAAAVGLFAAGVGAASAYQAAPSQVSDVPAAVRTAIEKFFGPSGSYDAQRQLMDGAACFLVTGSWKGQPTTLILSSAGDLQEVNRDISMAELPAAVQQKLRQAYPNVKFDNADALELHLFRVSGADSTRPVYIFAAGNRWDVGAPAKEVKLPAPTEPRR